MKLFLKISAGLFLTITLFIGGVVFVLWQGWYDPFLKRVQNYAVLVEVKYQEKIYRQINILSCRYRDVISPNPEASTVPDFLHVEVGKGQYIVANVQGKCWSNDVEVSLKELDQLDYTNWPQNSRELKVWRQSFVNLSADPVYVDEYLRASKLKDGSLGVGLVTAKAIMVQAEPKKILGQIPKWKYGLGGRNPAFRSPFLLECGYSLIKFSGFTPPPIRDVGTEAGGGYVRFTGGDKRISVAPGVFLKTRGNTFNMESDDLEEYLDVDRYRQSLYYSKDKSWYFDDNSPESIQRTYLIKNVEEELSPFEIEGAQVTGLEDNLWSQTERTQIAVFKSCKSR